MKQALSLLSAFLLALGCLAAGAEEAPQIDLEVVAENEQAIALYRKCGFRESGRRARALKFDNGTWHDEILMYKVLD